VVLVVSNPLFSLARTRAVIFDFDCTLFRLGVDWLQVKRDLAAAAQRLVGRAISFESFFWGFREVELIAGEHVRVFLDIIREAEERAARANTDALPLYERGIPVLQERCPGLVLGIVSSNFRRSIDIVLERFGASSLFGVVLGRDDVAEMKPSGVPILQACTALGVQPPEAVYCGDAPTDEEAAGRAGVPFIYERDLVIWLVC
jgi:phosphoglycolate phosphatase-like HAD superfamily hydrolase